MSARRERLALASFALLLGYFVVALLAGALDRAATIGWRELAAMSEREQLELALAWRASLGQWVGFDLVSPRGPLWQLLLTLGALGAEREPWRLALSRSVVFPLVSLLAVAWIAARRAAPWAARTWLLLVFGVLVLHLATSTLVPALGLVAIVLGGPASERSASRSLRHGALAGLAWAAAVFVEPTALPWALGAIVVLALLSPSLDGARVGIAGPAASLATLTVALGSFALVAGVGWLVEPLRDLAGRAGPELLAQTDTTGGLIFVGASFASVALGLRHDRGGAVLWAATVPAIALGLLRGDAADVYLGAIPGVAALALLGVGCWQSSRLASGVAALLVLLFVIGSMPRYDRSTVWQPSVLRRGWIALRGEVGPVREQNDLTVAAHALRDAHPRRCVLAPSTVAAARMVAGAEGPSDPMREPTGRGARLAAQIRNERCDVAIDELRTFDRPYALGAWTFGEDLLARAELYEPEKRIGPSLYRTRLRERPAPASETALGLDGGPIVHVLTEESPLVVRFTRPVPADHVIALALSIDAGPLESAVGRAPRIAAHFHRGATPIREPMLVPPEVLLDPSERLLLPVEAERAEHRWIAGVAVGDELAADRVLLSLVRPSGTRGAMVVRVEGAIELAPGAPPLRSIAEPTETRCRSSLDLAERADRAAFARHTRLEVVDGVVRLDPNAPDLPRAELFVPFTPCADACLVGQAGLEGEGSDGFHFEVHVIDGPMRPRISDRWITPGWRRPFEIPLEPWAGRPVFLRLGTAPGGSEVDDRVRIHDLRIRPCASMLSVIHALHEGQQRVVRGEPFVVGDTLGLPLLRRGEAPTEVRLPVHVPEGACLAVDLRGVELDAASGVAVGVVSNGRLHRIVREIFWPLDEHPERRLADLSLEPWRNQDVELYFAAWTTDLLHHAGRLEVMRPRVHRCGEPADWAF